MANIVITSNTNSIKVDFGVLGVSPLPNKATYNKDHIVKFALQPSDAYVTATNVGDNEWALSFNGTNGMQVDSVDGVAPTSNSDLFDKLSTLLA